MSTNTKTRKLTVLEQQEVEWLQDGYPQGIPANTITEADGELTPHLHFQNTHTDADFPLLFGMGLSFFAHKKRQLDNNIFNGMMNRFTENNEGDEGNFYDEPA